ncbi:acetyl-CoA carboxylase biotin carboxylase subunit [Dactylosporangium sp. CA-092794]|uniref:acetyl-CoA carboxylase biotin carboxylase subunit n=1 Tax=Dactylosporangium sp. CA-092794 TaxID=3239929 RepID=UPI003D9127C1
MTGREPWFRTLLIANRGEIALRIARTCREAGINVAAVYSTEDADTTLVRTADVAVRIGPPPARQSYLNMAAILEAARRCGADAIHPGYGFLAENADFSAACAANGIAFVGPSAAVIATLGDKVRARMLLAGHGMPMLPGSLHPVGDVTEAAAVAGQTGFPLIIKAAAGGGGRGMQVVHEPAQLAERYRGTRSAAQQLFGDHRVYIERYIAGARHVEIQILCDAFGNALHLGERDCSVQRRHQKIVEETPAPGLPHALVQRMAAAAIEGARAAGYVGAGTFEFLVDEAQNFYFMEVNCRIQVEHPVTEMATGIDLVREQLRIAAGHPIQLRQADIRPRGAVIECRVNAEDPDRGFAPAPGRLTEFSPPAGPFVRVDTYAHPGCRISAAYDSLLAKVVVAAPDREQAIARMHRALAEFRVSGPGVTTTIPFLHRVLDDPAFRRGAHDTRLVASMLDGADRRAVPASAPA